MVSARVVPSRHLMQTAMEGIQGLGMQSSGKALCTLARFKNLGSNGDNYGCSSRHKVA